MECTVSNRTYLSKETTRSLKSLLNKTETITEIQVKGKVYMELKDYRKLQKIDEIANDSSFRQIKPVYGAIQLLNLFEEQTERIRISAKSNGMVSDFYEKMTQSMPAVPDQIVANGNEIVIIPQGAYEAWH